MVLRTDGMKKGKRWSGSHEGAFRNQNNDAGCGWIAGS